MDLSEHLGVPPNMLAIRVGCRLVYKVVEPVSALVMVQPSLAPLQLLLADSFSIGKHSNTTYAIDSYGNKVTRTVLIPELTEILYDAILLVPDLADKPVYYSGSSKNHAFLPLEILRYTLPSRYCESDKLGRMAAQLFGHLPSGLATAQAICNWTHNHIAYRFGSGDATLSACEAIARGYGVCRDLAHVMVALCRALDLPARYAAGYMPLFEATDSDIGIDFHAYVEVFVAGAWHTFDPRHNRPHVGRVKIAHGLDAKDVAFATIYGIAETAAFQVWSYPVDPAKVHVGDAVEIPCCLTSD